MLIVSAGIVCAEHELEKCISRGAERRKCVFDVWSVLPVLEEFYSPCVRAPESALCELLTEGECTMGTFEPNTLTFDSKQAFWCYKLCVYTDLCPLLFYFNQLGEVTLLCFCLFAHTIRSLSL